MNTHHKLLAGYAETSTRKHPREPETVIVGQAEIDACVCQGAHAHPDGNGGWLRFKVRGRSRYYFQVQPY
jgi:hypothetical protein